MEALYTWDEVASYARMQPTPLWARGTILTDLMNALGNCQYEKGSTAWKREAAQLYGVLTEQVGAVDEFIRRDEKSLSPSKLREKARFIASQLEAVLDEINDPDHPIGTHDAWFVQAQYLSNSGSYIDFNHCVSEIAKLRQAFTAIADIEVSKGRARNHGLDIVTREIVKVYERFTGKAFSWSWDAEQNGKAFLYTALGYLYPDITPEQMDSAARRYKDLLRRREIEYFCWM